MAQKSAQATVGGVFGIHKPKNMTSAQVIRDLQFGFFQKSQLFAANLDRDQRLFEENRLQQHRGHRRPKKADIKVKIGHGGTLDPNATGVLVLGVDHGTRDLQQFLDCSKTYEATLVFGAATDSYDADGKVLRRSPFRNVSESHVKATLQQFRGKIQQRPPIYSALRIDGKKLYEYAREGKEPPREIAKRPVEVFELELLEWLPAGSHSEPVPQEDALEEEKAAVEKVMQMIGPSIEISKAEDSAGEDDAQNSGTKRKRSLDDDEDEDGVVTKIPKSEIPDETKDTALMSGALAPPEEPSAEDNLTASMNDDSQLEDPSLAKPPAVRLRMTVSSGFYVRSLAHDLGEAVGSAAYMSKLVRTGQGEFELGRNVLEYEEFKKGEDVWAPLVKEMFQSWNERNPERPAKEATGKQSRDNWKTGGMQRERTGFDRDRNGRSRRERNSSSPD